MKINGLDLFSGIGGMSLALGEWVRPIAYCENDPYCQAVLLSHMARGRMPRTPIWDDICTLKSFYLPERAEIIYGGFPCQDISVAGHGNGLDGKRSSLYWEVYRLAQEIKPKFIFLENVPNICTKGGWEVVSSLAQIGYDCRWDVISASSLGAPHLRERWFLLAYSQSERCHEIRLPHRKEAQLSLSPNNLQSTYGNYWKENASPICGMDDGIPNRVHRIRALGNAVVPEQARKAFKKLIGY